MLEMQSIPVVGLDGEGLDDGEGFELYEGDRQIAEVTRIGDDLRIRHVDDYYVELGYNGNLVVMPMETYQAELTEAHRELGLIEDDELERSQTPPQIAQNPRVVRALLASKRALRVVLRGER